MTETRAAFVDHLLRVVAFDYCDSIWWRTFVDGECGCHDNDVHFFVNCNDTFAWACSDSEEVTPENIGVLEQSFKDIEAVLGGGFAQYAGELFAARVRHMRPQGASYKECYDPKIWHLFDAAGAPRPSDREPFGNPIDRDSLNSVGEGKPDETPETA